MCSFTGERMLKVLKTKLDIAGIFVRRKSCRYRDFVLFIGLAAFLLFYGRVAHAKAVYSFTKTMGGTSNDSGQSVAVDSSGNVYITGSFRETVVFDPETGTHSITSKGEEDIFLTKFDPDGNYLYTKTIGGTSNDSGQSVAVDSSGNVYITGFFRETVVFDPETGTDSITSKGEEDIFLTKFDSDGNYLYTKTMGGTSNDFGQSVAVDGSGNVFITGYFSSNNADFNIGGTADTHTPKGLEDIFLTKINADGSYGYTRTMGGTDHDEGQSVAVDGSDNVYITGYFSSNNADFNIGGTADTHTSAGLEDIFLTKINADGSYGYTKTMGGTDHDYGRSVAMDSSDNVYITGSYSGTADFDPGSETDDHTSNGLGDIFLTKINSDGTYDLTETMGGTDQDFGRSVTVDDSVNVYLTGYFQQTVDFDPGSGTEPLRTSNGLEDIFLTKFRMVGFIVVPTSVTAPGAGGTATFTVKLLSEPSADVMLPVASSDANIGRVDTSSLTFKNSDWFMEQTVTITNITSTGLTYNILLGSADSSDTDYNDLGAPDVTVTITGTETGGSGCFIATAAYGSPLAPYVRVLSKFRDHYLITNRIGRLLVHFYYIHSPPMANFIKKNDYLRAIIRLMLIPLVSAGWLALKIGLVSAVALICFFAMGFAGLIRYVIFKKPS
jgi:hypothetical protein